MFWKSLHVKGLWQVKKDLQHPEQAQNPFEFAAKLLDEAIALLADNGANVAAAHAQMARDMLPPIAGSE